MNRRAFITLLGGAVAAWPLAASAQQQALPVVGFLSSRSPGESNDLVAAFRRGLRDSGFIEGQNLLIAFRWADGRYDRLPALAAELVDLRAAVLFAAGGPPAAFAAKAATQAIPIVFSAVSDPVRLGLVASLNRPGGNLTGMGIFTFDLATKSVQLLKELVPTAAVIAYLVNPSNPGAELYVKEAASTASALGIAVHVLNASTEHELDEAFASVAKLCAADKIFIKYPTYRAEQAVVSAYDKKNDLALLKTEMKNFGIAKFRLRGRLGEQVASYGFPYGNTLSSSGNFTLGNITALAGFGDDSTMVQVSSPMQPGNSGGPLMDSSGTIIGVSKGILGTLAAAEAAGGAVPQNVNFGVSSGTAVTFLGTRGIDAEVSVGASKLEPEAIAEIAMKFTVQISCD